MGVVVMRDHVELVKVKGLVYDDIRVVESNSIRFLRFGDGGNQGAINLNDVDKPVFKYQRYFKSLVDLMPSLNSFLAIGVGTGTSLRIVGNKFKDSVLTGVDIDPCVVDLAIDYFNCLDYFRVNYVFEDGMSYLSRCGSVFDLIFIDAYSESSIDTSFLQPSFLDIAIDHLSSNGVIACNIVSSFPLTGVGKTFLDRAKSLFPFVHVLPLSKIPFISQNIFVVLSNSDDVMSVRTL